MRRNASLDPAYFESLYAGKADPWDFETSAYERAKYDHTLASLPRPRFGSALEIGCANGVLTARLAERCNRLIAVDVADQALTAARNRCKALSNVRIEKARFPRDRVDGSFDLIVLSEVAYYWDDPDLAAAAAALAEASADGGFLLLVHWLGETDYPKSGDDAVRSLKRLTAGCFEVVVRERRPEYRLDLWRRRPRS